MGGLPALTVREDGIWHTVSKTYRLQASEALSARTLAVIRAAGLDPRRAFDLQSFLRGPGRVDVETKGNLYEILIAWLKTRLVRLCAQLMMDGKLSAVYSWHDLSHAFAQRNAGRGLVWLPDGLGHSSVSVTECYVLSQERAERGNGEDVDDRPAIGILRQPSCRST